MRYHLVVFALALGLIGCGGPLNPEPVAQVTVPGELGLRPLAWSPDGSLIAAANNQGAILLWGWDGRVLTPQTALKIGGGEVHGLAWHPTQDWLAGSVSSGGCCDKKDAVYVWDITTGAATLVDMQAGPTYSGVRWNSDGSRLGVKLSRSFKHDLRLWAGDTFADLGDFPGANNVAAWSPDGSRVVEIDPAGSAQIVAVDGGQPGVPLEGAYDEGVFRWSPDGGRLAAHDSDHNLRIWDAATGRQLRLIDRQQIRSTGADMAWSPDGARLALGAAQVWDANTGAEVYTSKSVAGSIDRLIWSADGRLLAGVAKSVDEPNELWAWDITTGKAWKLRALRADINIDWEPGGHRLAVLTGTTLQIVDVDALR